MKKPIKTRSIRSIWAELRKKEITSKNEKPSDYTYASLVSKLESSK